MLKTYSVSGYLKKGAFTSIKAEISSNVLLALFSVCMSLMYPINIFLLLPISWDLSVWQFLHKLHIIFTPCSSTLGDAYNLSRVCIRISMAVLQMHILYLQSCNRLHHLGNSKMKTDKSTLYEFCNKFHPLMVNP